VNLRISINAKRIEGPWGGGAHSVRSLERHFTDRGHYVTRSLEPSLDAILLHSLRPDGESTSYPPDAVAHYRRRFPQTVVITRVNTCDEHQAADRGLNRMVLAAANLADSVVFVSEFSRRLFVDQGLDASKTSHVIRTGADARHFYPEGRTEWMPNQRIRLVTHHWSSWVMKGIDIYDRLDWLLGESKWSSLFEFTYIGKLPLGFRLRNSRVLPVMHGEGLLTELHQHHACVTGARYEAGGNHYIEAMRSGLPVLYLESGANAEYCHPFGIGFHPGNFERKLRQLRNEYPRLREAVLNCPYDAESMAGQYLALLETLVAERRAATSRRVSFQQKLGWGRNPLGRIWPKRTTLLQS
jgi:hypothetical protein